MKYIEEKWNGNIEIVLVNDGSSYGVTEAKINYLKERINNFLFIDNQINRGKGNALRQGVKKASGNFTIYTDIDFPYTRNSFNAITNTLLTESANVIAGNRGVEYYENTPLFRKWISKTLRRIMKTFLKLPVDDTQCGIKGFDNKGKEVFLSTEINRFLFDLELIKLSAKRNLKVEPVKVELKEGVVFSKVRMKILLAEGFNFFKVLLRN